MKGKSSIGSRNINQLQYRRQYTPSAGCVSGPLRNPWQLCGSYSSMHCAVSSCCSWLYSPEGL